MQQAVSLTPSSFSAKRVVDLHVELLHGSYPPTKKREIMEPFATRRDARSSWRPPLSRLASTCPNATVMIVDGRRPRFGLWRSSHRLRGRVGRGSRSRRGAFDLGVEVRAVAMARLAAMEHTEDGFELANYDLSLAPRGRYSGKPAVRGDLRLKLVNIVRDEQGHRGGARRCRAPIMAADPGLAERRSPALGARAPPHVSEQAPANSRYVSNRALWTAPIRRIEVTV